jgi:hypothetical protein
MSVFDPLGAGVAWYSKGLVIGSHGIKGLPGTLGGAEQAA